MKKEIIAGFIIVSFIDPAIYCQDTPVDKGMAAITTESLKAQLGFLASDWTEGRLAGEKGEFLAADYIASMLQVYGVKPGGDQAMVRNARNNLQVLTRTYFQNFNLLKSVPVSGQILKLETKTEGIIRTSEFTSGVDYITGRSNLQNIAIEAGVVFAGYGFINERLKINEPAKTDFRGKFVLKLAGVPLIARKILTNEEISASERVSETLLIQSGAIGIIEFDPENTLVGNPEFREFNDMSPSEGTPRTGRAGARFTIPGITFPDELIRLRVSARVANEILKGSGISLAEYLKRIESNSASGSQIIQGKTISFKTSVSQSQVAVRNILGIIEGNDPEQVIVVGAHYDHMGTGNGYVWNGADDNASGTVGVMALAKACMATGKKPEKSIIFALWTSEEAGLLGSRYYVRNLTYPLQNLKLNINFDMISRYISDDKPSGVEMTYTKKYPVFQDITVQNLKKHKIDLVVNYVPSDDPPGGSDHRSFVEADIPILRFKPGHREEYHTPADEIDTVDWDIMEKIIRISFADLWELANSSW
jgi:hypothetical protein